MYYYNLLNFALCVLRYPRVNVPCVFTCSHTNVPYVPTCSHPNVPCALMCSRVKVPRKYTCPRSNMPCVSWITWLTWPRDHLPSLVSCFDATFSASLSLLLKICTVLTRFDNLINVFSLVRWIHVLSKVINYMHASKEGI